MYTNYSIAILISRQIIISILDTNKLNLKLIKVSQYLSSFKLVVKHKLNKFNVISDALFKLKQNKTNNNLNNFEILEILYKHSIKSLKLNQNHASLYHVILIKMNDDFKIRLKIAYVKNKH